MPSRASSLRIAEREPLVVVIEDLHWADPASLQLVAFVARELHGARLLVIGTYREREMAGRPTLRDGVALASRRVELRGLGRDDVGQFVEAVTASVPPATLVDDVHRITEGNPFFLGEIVRVLKAEHAIETRDLASASVRLPLELRATIRRRLEPLGARARALLEVAAVIGEEFDGTVVAAACEVPSGDVATRLATAMAAGIVRDVPGSVGRYRFGHALIRETLYDDLAPSARSDLHRRIGHALEAAFAGSGDPPLGELAHHFFHAVPLGEPEKAMHYAERAGERARTSFGYEEAAGHYERALQLIRLLPPDERRRLRLRVALGSAALRAGDHVRTRETFELVARDARILGDDDALAAAALGYHAARAPTGAVDATELRLLEDALRAHGSTPDARRAQLLVGLARAVFYSEEPERSLPLVDEALTIARRLDDPATLALAVYARYFLVLGPDDLQARFAALAEAIEVADRAELGWVSFSARVSLVHDLLESCDVAAAEREIEVLAAAAERTRFPPRRWVVAVLRASIAISSGRLEEGAALAARALEVPRDAQDPSVLMTYCGQMFVVRRELGDLGERLEASIRTFATSFPGMHSWRATLALMHAEAGRRDTARAMVDRLAARDFAAVRRDMHFIPSLAILAETVRVLDDAERAEQIHALLMPYAARNVVASWWSPTYIGSVERYLGVAATTARRPEDAAGHFERAVAANDRMGVRAEATQTRVDYARLLLERDATGDRERALELLAEARGTADDLGLRRLRANIADLDAGSIASSRAEAVESAMCRRIGEDEWEIGHAGKTTRHEDARGFHHLARLLREPGREIHVLDLAAVDAPESGDATAERERGDTRTAYRHRLADLRSELDDAERFGDPGRAERARAEIEFLGEELARADDTADRDAAATERARLNVTRALGRAIERIAAVHPVLGEHLVVSVRRGALCCYAPDARVPIRWEL